MTCKESIKWLENLKEAMGESQYQGLWHYEQALAETIELLQSDRLVELPCKVGDDIYCISGNQIYKAKVHCVSCGGKYSTDWQFHIYDCDKDNACVLLKNYKENWFLSKSEAEAKLKELEK